MPPPKDPIKYKKYIELQSKSHLGQPAWNKGIPCTEKQKQIISKANTGRTSVNKGKKFSEDWCKKLSLAKMGNNYKKGKILSDESRKNISRAQTGVKRSSPTKETRNKLSKANTGKIHDEEWNRKVSIAKKGIPNGRDGEKHPMYGKPAWNRGIPHSDITRSKLKFKRSFRVIPYKDTKPERMMQIALSLNGIKFEKHKSINDWHGFYHQVDLFIEPNICVEVDGDYWHANPDKYKAEDRINKNMRASDVWARDIRITHKLNLLGYNVIRIWEFDIKKNAHDCATRIINLMRSQMEVKK